MNQNTFTFLFPLSGLRKCLKGSHSFFSYLIKTFALGALVASVCEVSVGHAQVSSNRVAEKKEEKPLPERTLVIDIDSPERKRYSIALVPFKAPVFPKPRGASANKSQVKEKEGSEGEAQPEDVIKNDLSLVGIFQWVGKEVLPSPLNHDPSTFESKKWTASGVQGVIKGQITYSKSKASADLRLYELGKKDATLSKTYKGSQENVRGWMHDFANHVLLTLTGKKGAFGTRIAYAKRHGPGRKDVYVSDFDGFKVRRISKPGGISMLPAFGPGGIWYSKLTPMGMFITNSEAKESPIIGGEGMNMGGTFCQGRIYFSSTRDGNSELYSAKSDGSDIQRLTHHSGIDVSPACGPNGKIAFVSSRHGSPQIFIMDGDGSNQKRVTFKGSYNQTPSWCSDASQSLIAFTGMGEGTDIYTINLKTQEYVRLTQRQGVNKDPAFSPDCRMIAFWSSRGGIFISDLEGAHQALVLPGRAETIRWSSATSP